MDLDKKYCDSDGQECNIIQMLNREPEWAANILQRGEAALEALITAKDILIAYDYYLVKHAHVKVPCAIIHSKITPAIHVMSGVLNTKATSQQIGDQ